MPRQRHVRTCSGGAPLVSVDGEPAVPQELEPGFCCPILADQPRAPAIGGDDVRPGEVVILRQPRLDGFLTGVEAIRQLRQVAPVRADGVTARARKVGGLTRGPRSRSRATIMVAAGREASSDCQGAEKPYGSHLAVTGEAVAWFHTLMVPEYRFRCLGTGWNFRSSVPTCVQTGSGARWR